MHILCCVNVFFKLHCFDIVTVVLSWQCSFFVVLVLVRSIWMQLPSFLVGELNELMPTSVFIYHHSVGGC